MCLYDTFILTKIAFISPESWSRPILKRSSSYRDRQQARREYQADPTRALQKAVKNSQSGSQGATQKNARIPESVTGNHFRYAPITSISDQPDESRSATQTINKFKRSMQAAKQR
jgi:transcription factor SPN1